MPLARDIARLKFINDIGMPHTLGKRPAQAPAPGAGPAAAASPTASIDEGQEGDALRYIIATIQHKNKHLLFSSLKEEIIGIYKNPANTNFIIQINQILNIDIHSPRFKSPIYGINPSSTELINTIVDLVELNFSPKEISTILSGANNNKFLKAIQRKIVEFQVKGLTNDQIENIFKNYYANSHDIGAGPAALAAGSPPPPPPATSTAPADSPLAADPSLPPLFSGDEDEEEAVEDDLSEGEEVDDTAEDTDSRASPAPAPAPSVPSSPVPSAPAAGVAPSSSSVPQPPTSAPTQASIAHPSVDYIATEQAKAKARGIFRAEDITENIENLITNLPIKQLQQLTPEVVVAIKLSMGPNPTSKSIQDRLLFTRLLLEADFKAKDIERLFINYTLDNNIIKQYVHTIKPTNPDGSTLLPIDINTQIAKTRAVVNLILNYTFSNDIEDLVKDLNAEQARQITPEIAKNINIITSIVHNNTVFFFTYLLLKTNIKAKDIKSLLSKTSYYANIQKIIYSILEVSLGDATYADLPIQIARTQAVANLMSQDVDHSVIIELVKYLTEEQARQITPEFAKKIKGDFLSDHSVKAQTIRAKTIRGLITRAPGPAVGSPAAAASTAPGPAAAAVGIPLPPSPPPAPAPAPSVPSPSPAPVAPPSPPVSTGRAPVAPSSPIPMPVPAPVVPPSPAASIDSAASSIVRGGVCILDHNHRYHHLLLLPLQLRNKHQHQQFH